MTTLKIPIVFLLCRVVCILSASVDTCDKDGSSGKNDEKLTRIKGASLLQARVADVDKVSLAEDEEKTIMYPPMMNTWGLEDEAVNLRVANEPSELIVSQAQKSSTRLTGTEREREVRKQEWDLFQLLNQLRADGFTCPAGGAPHDWVFAPDSSPLLFDCRLWRASYLHSQDMADNNYASHTSQDGRQPIDRGNEQGVPPWEHRNAETLGVGDSTAQGVLNGWKGSSAHCRTMMHPDLRMFGAGYADKRSDGSPSSWGHYWTQMLSWSTTGLDDSCYPNSTPSPPGVVLEEDCDLSFDAPSNFGFITGPWTGDCRTKQCAFQNLAKSDDGDYIAGYQDGQYYKMVKFTKDGANVPNSARYYAGSAPSDASDLVSKYGTGASAQGNYQFSKGAGFLCTAN